MGRPSLNNGTAVRVSIFGGDPRRELISDRRNAQTRRTSGRTLRPSWRPRASIRPLARATGADVAAPGNPQGFAHPVCNIDRAIGAPAQTAGNRRYSAETAQRGMVSSLQHVAGLAEQGGKDARADARQRQQDGRVGYSSVSSDVFGSSTGAASASWRTNPSSWRRACTLCW